METGDAHSHAPHDNPSNPLDDQPNITPHLRILNPEHTPPKRLERAVPPRIMPLAPFMRGPIDLDDQPKLRAREVHDGVTDDELPPKSNAELRPRELAPQDLLARRGRKPHAPRFVLEPSSACS